VLRKLFSQPYLAGFLTWAGHFVPQASPKQLSQRILSKNTNQEHKTSSRWNLYRYRKFRRNGGMRDLELGGVPFESLASRSESRTSQRKTHQHNLQMNFICMPLGRLHAWRLCHVALPVNEAGTLVATDQDLFKTLLASIYKHLRSRGLLRFLFPLRISRVEYWEFILFNDQVMAVELHNDGKGKP